jgi:hypothetical protein
MAKGESGRLVIEVDPALKRKLYSALDADRQTLKDWFLAAASRYLKSQPKNRSPLTSSKSKPKK